MIVKKPNYEIIDRGKYKLNGKTLIIFDSIDKEFCYEYFEQKSMFYCLACMGMKPQRKTVKAKVHFEGTEKEYVEIICNEHICKKRKYQPENYQKIHEFVLKPNFEIQRYTKHVTEKKKLIVFNENDKSLCYSYYYDSRRESYVCKNCSKKGKLVTAKLLQNSEEEEYIILSIVKHICNLKPYVPLKGEITIDSSQIKLMTETKNGLPKLFVFVGNDKKKCYIFTTFRHTLTTQKYYCTGCRVKIDGRKSVRNEFKEMVSGYLVTDKNGKHSLKLPANYKHICSPKNFEPDEFKSLPKSYDFFFFKENNDRGIPQLAIIHPAEKNLCFHFRFNKHCRHFICKKCEKEKKKNLTLVIQMDESGKAYFNHDYKKHLCKPQKILSILGPKIRKLKDDEINHNDYLKSKQQKKPKEKIINLPNFELCTSKTGVKDAKLILFHETDKNLCYGYSLHATSKTYICYRCVGKGNRCVTAKLKTNENGEKYLTLGKSDHVCEPLKYQPQNPIIKSPNFLIINRDDEIKPTKIIIFTNSSKDFCYEYSFFKSSKKYGCTGCNNMGRKVHLKLIKNDESGEECIELLNSVHICQPRKYVPEKFSTKIIPESMFKLCKNTKGEENKKLLVFTSDDKKMAFVYYSFSKESYYVCSKCINQEGKVVSAKLCENKNGEKFLELNRNEHVCSTENVNLDELDSVIIEDETMFVFHFSNKSSEANRRMILFTSEEKEFVYVYNWCQKNSYRCFKCKKHDKFVIAKVYENESGGKYLELNGTKHVCEPEKFNRENFPLQKNEQEIIQKPMFELSEDSKGQKNKKLIIFSSEDKKMGYVFNFTRGHTFRCAKCNTMKVNNLAKLKSDENGNPFVLHDPKKHVCERQPCQTKIIPESMFKIGKITNSIKNNGLIVFTSEKMDKFYEYGFSERNYYKCRSCLKKDKTVSALLKENENGQKYLELNNANHICKPKS